MQRVTHAPAQQFKHQPSQVGLHDLGLAMRLQKRLLRPQPIADTWPGAPRPSATLIRTGPVDLPRQQACHAAAWLKLRRTLTAHINHDMDARHCETGLGDIGREDDPTPAALRPQHGLLLCQRELAMQRHEVHI